MQKLKPIPILMIVALVVAMSGCVDTSQNNTIVEKNNTTTETTDPGTFENEYLSFEIPEGITANDDSSALTIPILISINENGEKIGSIKLDSETSQADIMNQNPSSYKTAGLTSYEVIGDDSITRYILLDNYAETGNMIKITFNFNKQNVYNKIVDSLEIKKTPN